MGGGVVYNCYGHIDAFEREGMASLVINEGPGRFKAIMIIMI